MFAIIIKKSDVSDIKKLVCIISAVCPLFIAILMFVSCGEVLFEAVLICNLDLDVIGSLTDCQTQLHFFLLWP